MDKYIKELISKKDTVIIPKFGALLVTVSGKGVIMFNEHLKFNDGLLAGYVAEQESIDKDAALKKLEEYAFKIMGDLDTGEPYSIDGLGAFYKDSSGSILFNQYKKEASIETATPKAEKKPPKSEAKETQTISKKEKTAKTDKPVSEKKTKENKADKSKEDAKTKEGSKASKTEEKAVEKPIPKTKKAKEKKPAKEEKPAIEKKESKASEDKIQKAAEANKKSETEKGIDDLKPNVAKKDSDSAVLSALSSTDGLKSTDEKAKATVKKAKPSIEEKVSVKEASKTAHIEEKVEVEQAVKVEAKSKVDVENTAQPMDHVSPTNEKVELPPVHISKDKPKKKKRIGVLILLLAIIGLATFVGLKFDMVKSWFQTEEVADYNSKEKEPDQKDSKDLQEGGDLENEDQNTENEGNDPEVIDNSDQETDDLKNEAELEHEAGDDDLESQDDSETEIVEEPVPVKEPEPEPQPDPVASSGSNGQYHIIASAFRSESNADNYVASLKEMGFTSASKLGKINGLYTVAAGSYGTSADANSAVQEVRTKTGKAAWVLKY